MARRQKPDALHVSILMETVGLTRKDAELFASTAGFLQGSRDAVALRTANAESVAKEAPRTGCVVDGRHAVVAAGSVGKETGLVPITRVPLSSITPSRLNDSVYRPPSEHDADIQEMARSMREHGVLQALTITSDGFILSGHRRYCAATVAGLDTVPVVVEPITSDDPSFARLLVMHNQQRQIGNLVEYSHQE